VSALVFRLREPPPERLDLAALVPHRLAGLCASEIERLPVGTSRFRFVVGDVFAVSGSDPADIRIEGGSDRLDHVGSRLAEGRIAVAGDVGQRLGFAMTGGEIWVDGSAGPFAASGASGGAVRVAGDADASAGGAVYGAAYGLDGATLAVEGRAGPRLGDRMRSGLIVAGAAGDHAGCRMIAGTIVAGAVGDHPGYGMRRGTVLIRSHGAILPTFVGTGSHRLVVLRLLAKTLAAVAPAWADMAGVTVRRLSGDLATLGKGEILVTDG
jgi:formylmethanofuran dehydrogenase subunit C